MAVIQIRIKDLDRASGKIRHEKEVEVTIDGSFKTRPGAAEEQPVVSDNPVVVEKSAAVGLKDTPKLDHEIGVRRAEPQSRWAGSAEASCSSSRLLSRVLTFWSRSSICFCNALMLSAVSSARACWPVP